MAKYSIFIPFYNEEKILEQHSLRVYNQLKKDGYDFDIYLVNDSSKDKSPEIAKKLSKKYPQIHSISYSNGPSRRENLFWSFPKSSSEIVAFTDLDLAVDEKYFKTLFSELENQNADICTASRYEPGSVVSRSLFRRLISMSYRKTVQTLFRCPVNDFQCGFKAFRRQCVMKVLPECSYDKSLTRGWFLDAEFIVRAHKKGMKIVSFPVKWNSGKKSSFNVFRDAKLIPYLLKLWWNLQNNKSSKNT
jgi:hypothetical protein